MRLTGLMVVRNESWILGVSLRAALKYCDKVCVIDHSSWDETPRIIHEIQGEHPYRVDYSPWIDSKTVMIKSQFDGIEYPCQQPDPDAMWKEMEIRQHSLELGRKFGGDTFAIIDDDEILTGDLLDVVRLWANSLKPGELIDLPMIQPWKGFENYRDDNWTHSGIVSLMFKDKPDLTWQAQGDGYQYHNRPPHGIVNRLTPLKDKRSGGVMHCQWVDWPRLKAKHIWYAYMEKAQWPDRMSDAELLHKYSAALKEEDCQLQKMPREWLGPYQAEMKYFKPGKTPWYEFEVNKLIRKHGEAYFAGLNKGMLKR